MMRNTAFEQTFLFIELYSHCLFENQLSAKFFFQIDFVYIIRLILNLVKEKKTGILYAVYPHNYIVLYTRCQLLTKFIKKKQ